MPNAETNPKLQGQNDLRRASPPSGIRHLKFFRHSDLLVRILFFQWRDIANVCIAMECEFLTTARFASNAREAEIMSAISS